MFFWDIFSDTQWDETMTLNYSCVFSLKLTVHLVIPRDSTEWDVTLTLTVACLRYARLQSLSYRELENRKAD